MYQVSPSAEAIDLGEILKNANLTQLQLEKAILDSYEKDDQFIKPTILREHYNLSEDFFIKNIEKAGQQPEEFKELHLAEKAAIFHYTTNEGYDMNSLLRGNYSKLHKSRKNLRYLLINAMVAASGLNKLRDVTVDVVTRAIDDIEIPNTDGTTSSLIKQMKFNVDHQVISTEKAFISTTFTTEIGTGFTQGKQALIIKSVKGKRVSGLSASSYECEFLIPPSTQLRWVSYQEKEDGMFIFAVEGANVVDNAEKPHETKINSDFTADSLTVEVVGNPEILNHAVDTPVENPSAEISQELMCQKIKSFCEQQSLLLLKEKKFLLNETERQTFLENLPRLEAISDIEQLKAFYNRALELENKSYASKDFLDQLCEFFEDLVDFFVHGYDYVSNKQQQRNTRDFEQSKTNQAISSLLDDTKNAISPKKLVLDNEKNSPSAKFVGK